MLPRPTRAKRCRMQTCFHRWNSRNFHVKWTTLEISLKTFVCYPVNMINAFQIKSKMMVHWHSVTVLFIVTSYIVPVMISVALLTTASQVSPGLAVRCLAFRMWTPHIYSGQSVFLVQSVWLWSGVSKTHMYRPSSEVVTFTMPCFCGCWSWTV